MPSMWQSDLSTEPRASQPLTTRRVQLECFHSSQLNQLLPMRAHMAKTERQLNDRNKVYRAQQKLSHHQWIVVTNEGQPAVTDSVSTAGYCEVSRRSCQAPDSRCFFGSAPPEERDT